MQQPLPVGLAIFALFLLFCLGMAIAPGCQLARDLDRHIWDGASGTDPQDPATGDTNPPAAPPIVEIAAALLAAGGFGGMARWISKAKAAANGRADRLQVDLDELRTRVNAHDAQPHKHNT